MEDQGRRPAPSGARHGGPEQPPTGTVTFLVAALGRAGGDGDGGACAEVVHPVVAAHGGTCLDGPGTNGDRPGPARVEAVFRSALDAAAAALDLQREPGARADPPLPLRVGLHTGEVRAGTGSSTGTGAGTVRLAARLCEVAHPGQILVSSVTAALVSEALPRGALLADVGAHRLRDPSGPERVFELRPADRPGGFPPLDLPGASATNLPAQLTSFVGRGDELAAVRGLLGTERLVTLTGTGGCGKTRLAVQAAAELADRWPDGVWWVDLGPLTDASRVAELVAATTRVIVEPVGGALRALALHLRDRRLLVCLDNCEHLLDAAAELADVLLRSCAGVSVLATSREPLGVASETVWRVPSMVEREAVSLFEARAAQVQSGFTVAGGHEDTVRTICRRLDGIPLAVELAAAWVRALTPAQIAAGLHDRFRLLAGGPRTIARQRTLSASVSWSHDLLDGGDRAVFRRLAVFAGGFTVEAARAVCAFGRVRGEDVLGALGRLVDKSLVVADHRDGEARYRLLETIRQYAGDRLEASGETAAARDRHLDHALALAEAAEPELEQADQDAWRERLEVEHDNLRSALDWGLSGPDPERARRLAAGLPRLWLLHGHAHEGLGYLGRAMDAAPDDRSALQARLLAGTSLLGAAAGRLDLTVDAATRGLDVAGPADDRTRARCLTMLAYVDVHMDFAAARSRCVEARRHAEAAGDAFGVDLSLTLEGMAATNTDRHDEAAPLLAAALERSRARGDRLLAAFALLGRLHGAVLTGDVRRAVRLGREAVDVAEPLGDYYTVGATTSDLAWATGLAGDLDAAHRLMETLVRSIEGAVDAVDAPFMAVTLGKLHLWRGDLDEAIVWLDRASRFAEPFLDNQIVARALPALASAHRRRAAPDAARAHAARGAALARRLDLPHVVAEALDESALVLAGSDPARAEQLHHEALALRVAHGLRTFYPDSLDALARHAAQVGRHAEATRLLAASDPARDAAGHPRSPVDLPDHEALAASLRAALGPERFARAWSEGASLAPDQAVAYVTRARGARGRPSSGWPSLTPTELEIVALAVDGLTNPEIGARLLISRNTVKTHLGHVYAKLGVANRTELATLASERPN